MMTQNMQEDRKLDNPVWYSLSETHQQFAIDYGNIKFYHPDYCPFGGFIKAGNTSLYIHEYSLLESDFFVVGERPAYEKPLLLANELVCLQMIAGHTTGTNVIDSITELGHENNEELFALVTLVQPGYFRKKTALLGTYYGIFKNGQLVAATGERMAMNLYCEISAVVTHPDHTGKGYAKQLVAHTVNQILLRDKLPYLHVAETNTAAINLYEKLGFTTRRKISFWNIIKKPNH